MPGPRYSAPQHAVRWLARAVPLGLLSSLLLPVAARRALAFANRQGAARASLLRRLPGAPRSRLPRLLLERTRVELNWLSWTCRDRFHHPRWRRRIAWRGEHHLAGALASGRSVVIATVHYGPLIFLGRWMCARGWRTGALADQPAWIDPHTRRTPDGRRLAPRIFLPRHTRRLLRFLRRPAAVIVAMDFPRGRTEPVPAGDRSLALATGALRLAAATGAAVIPCLARERWFWRAEVSFFPPIADELVADPARHAEACRLIARPFLAAIHERPHQCADLLLERFEARAPEGTAAGRT